MSSKHMEVQKFLSFLFILAKETLRSTVQDLRLDSPLLMVKVQKGEGPLLMAGQPNPLGVGDLRLVGLEGENLTQQ